MIVMEILGDNLLTHYVQLENLGTRNTYYNTDH